MLETLAEATAAREPFRLFDARTFAVDAFVIPAVEASLAPHIATPFAVAAVGGYGRRELFPHSDVDLLLLFENDSDLVGIKGPIAELLRVLWDAGLRASHSVRTISECC